MYNIEEEYTKYVEEVGGRIIFSDDPRRDIRRARVSLGITQEELGKFVKLRRETVSRIENGIISPTLGFVKKFSKMIAVTRVIRDLQALEEVSAMSGKTHGSLSMIFLRSCFSVPLKDLELVFDIGVRGYYKSRSKIIKKIKSEV